MVKMAVCISCGNETGENVKFCTHCGAPQEDERVQTEPVVSETENVEPAMPAVEPVGEEPESVRVEPEYIPKLGFENAAPKATVTEADKVPVSRVDVSAPENAAVPAAAQPFAEADKPGKKSKWGVISTWGYVGIDLLLAIPGVGLILAIIWACGGCRKYAKRNYARSRLIFLFAAVLLTVAAALVIRFVFPEVIVQIFEQLFPGYTIVF